MSEVVAIDIGGTTIKAALVDGAVLSGMRTVVTPAGPDAVLDAVSTLVAELRTPRTAAVGVVTPGLVDPHTGVVRYAANLGWRDVPLRDLLSPVVALPVAVGHDVAAAAAAEAAAQPGGPAADLLFVAIGTGIAAVHVIGGEPVRGATGAAGELGHVTVDPHGEECGCGQRGCLEAYSSAAGIARRYAASGGQPGLDAAAIERVRGEDALAALVWSEAAEALGRALATATLLLDPGRIVLGGGLALAGDALVEPVRTALAAHLAWRQPPALSGGVLGTDAGVRGAAALAHRLPTTSEGLPA